VPAGYQKINKKHTCKRYPVGPMGGGGGGGGMGTPHHLGRGPRPFFGGALLGAI